MKKSLFCLVSIALSTLAPAWADYYQDWRFLFLQIETPDEEACIARIKERLGRAHWSCDVRRSMLKPYQIGIGFYADQVNQADLLKAALAGERDVRLTRVAEREVPRGTPEPLIIEPRVKGSKPVRSYALLALQGAVFRLEDGRAILDLRRSGYPESVSLANLTRDIAKEMFGRYETDGDITTFEMKPQNGALVTFLLDTRFADGRLTAYRLRSYRSAMGTHPWESISDDPGLKQVD